MQLILQIFHLLAEQPDVSNLLISMNSCLILGLLQILAQTDFEIFHLLGAAEEGDEMGSKVLLEGGEPQVVLSEGLIFAGHALPHFDRGHFKLKR